MGDGVSGVSDHYQRVSIGDRRTTTKILMAGHYKTGSTWIVVRRPLICAVTEEYEGGSWRNASVDIAHGIPAPSQLRRALAWLWILVRDLKWPRRREMMRPYTGDEL
jgi:hypothetical protein